MSTERKFKFKPGDKVWTARWSPVLGIVVGELEVQSRSRDVVTLSAPGNNSTRTCHASLVYATKPAALLALRKHMPKVMAVHRDMLASALETEARVYAEIDKMLEEA